MESKKILLNVTDLSSYLYCPRKFYMGKVLGLREPVNKAMIEGGIRHKVLENFSNKEEALVNSFGSISKGDVVEKFRRLLDLIIKNVFEKNIKSMKGFQIDAKELYNKIFDSMKADILLRADSIDDGIRKGFTGKELWQNLEPKYISEMVLVSEKLGLRGRADRVMISEGSVLPFELKTRKTDKVWDSDEVQVTCYAMMLEEKYNVPVSLGILEAGGEKHEIVIDEKRKKKVLDLIEEVRGVIQNGGAAYPGSFGKCQGCGLKGECEEMGVKN